MEAISCWRKSRVKYWGLERKTYSSEANSTLLVNLTARFKVHAFSGMKPQKVPLEVSLASGANCQIQGTTALKSYTFINYSLFAPCPSNKKKGDEEQDGLNKNQLWKTLYQFRLLLAFKIWVQSRAVETSVRIPDHVHLSPFLLLKCCRLTRSQSLGLVGYIWEVEVPALFCLLQVLQ